MAVAIRRDWRIAPTVPLKLNERHWLAQRVLFAAPCNQPVVYDVVTRRRLVIGGSAVSPERTERGMAQRVGSGSALTYTPNTTLTRNALTLLCLCSFNDALTGSRALMRFENTGSNSAGLFQVYRTSLDQIRSNVGGSSGFTSYNGTTVPGTGVVRGVAVTWNGSVISVYLDHTLDGSSTASARTISGLNRGGFGITTEPADANILMGALIADAMSVDEIAEWWANPFGMFEPEARRLYLPSLPAATGSFALTDAPDAAVVAGDVIVDGSFALTDANDVAEFTGTAESVVADLTLGGFLANLGNMMDR